MLSEIERFLNYYFKHFDVKLFLDIALNKKGYIYTRKSIQKLLCKRILQRKVDVCVPILHPVSTSFFLISTEKESRVHTAWSSSLQFFFLVNVFVYWIFQLWFKKVLLGCKKNKTLISWLEKRIKILSALE